jgi:hypothetical protein
MAAAALYRTDSLAHWRPYWGCHRLLSRGKKDEIIMEEFDKSEM